MDPQPLRLLDLRRIVLGEVPWTFLVEALGRLAALYALLLVAMRLMGKRMASQTSRNELAALVSLAAAIGPAVEDPTRGLLPPVVIAAVILAGQRAIAAGAHRSARFARATQGDVTALVVDGEVALDALRAVAVSRERLFAELRNAGIAGLGRVRRAYLEATGRFTLVTYDEARPGLTLVPAWDAGFLRAQRRAEGVLACGACGHVEARREGAPGGCERCGAGAWCPAVVE